MAMTFVPIGVGDAFSALHYSSSVAVEGDGRWLLVDCPHPIRKVLREASARAGVDLDVSSFAGVVVTHVHADHSAGLEDFAYFAHFALRSRPVLAAHPRVLAQLWERLAPGMDSLADPVTWQPRPMRLEDYLAPVPLDEGREIEVAPGFRVACRPTRHHVFTTALRIRAGGRTLGMSADTAHDPALIEWLSAADVFLHETGPGIHTPYDALAALPAALRARMRLIHYPDGFDPGPGGIERLEEGGGTVSRC
jgi:ribonuclease BN (tRNA processing enzyme)